MGKVIVAGVGMTRFVKPTESPSYTDMAVEAISAALADAGLGLDLVREAYAGYVYGDSTSGQRALYGVGMVGIPVVNVNNNCATGSTALWLARNAVASGRVECALAFGFEQMRPGALIEHWTDRPGALELFNHLTDEIGYDGDVPMAPKMFGGAGIEHQRRYGTRNETFAMVRAKASRHAIANERAIFRKEVSVEEVLASPPVTSLLTRLQCCPPTCGSAAAVLVSPAFARRHGIADQVTIVGQSMTTDRPSTFSGRDMMKVVGYDMTAEAARAAYAEAGLGPSDVDVAELHDCFTSNELISYEGLGFCLPGQAEKFIVDGDNTYGGKVVTNPSGGLLSKGHPLGATGLAQCFELTGQLRGVMGARQVEGARVALQHNIGVGGACVVTLYSAN